MLLGEKFLQDNRKSIIFEIESDVDLVGFSYEIVVFKYVLVKIGGLNGNK